ncbi:MAG: hypothetical protein D6714_03990 [Bacteroidetes bacterium]|nr:MAG: hypothetical protein D6714_03990 [Bacteroidota bacterium]
MPATPKGADTNFHLKDFAFVCLAFPKVRLHLILFGRNGTSGEGKAPKFEAKTRAGTPEIFFPKK